MKTVILAHSKVHFRDGGKKKKKKLRRFPYVTLRYAALKVYGVTIDVIKAGKTLIEPESLQV